MVTGRDPAMEQTGDDRVREEVKEMERQQGREVEGGDEV